MNESSQKERVTDLGNIRIRNDVLSSIASIAAAEVRGVYRLGGASAVRNLYGLIAKRGGHRGVRVVSAENDIRLFISVIVDYGINIPRVADEVQANVKRQIEKMTGLVPQEVNVNVEGVHMAPPTKEEGI